MGYLINDLICNPNRDYDSNIEKFITFFTMTSQQRWHSITRVNDAMHYITQ